MSYIQAEGKMSSMKTEQDRLRMDAEEQINKYRTALSDLENEKTELMAFLEEEKRLGVKKKIKKYISDFSFV